MKLIFAGLSVQDFEELFTTSLKSYEWVTVIDDTRMILLAHIIQTKDISEPHPCYGSRPVDRLANAMIEAVENHRHSIKSNACSPGRYGHF